MNTQIFRSETFYFKSVAHKCQRKALTLRFMKRTLMPSGGKLRKFYFPFTSAVIFDGMQTKMTKVYKDFINALPQHKHVVSVICSSCEKSLYNIYIHEF